jgi:dihydrofolate reductase
VDFITSLDGYGGAKGWPGWWGLEGPEYLNWLGELPERSYTILMGANTYRLMYGFTPQSGTSEFDLRSKEVDSMTELTNASKVVFSSTLQSPLPWANTQLISEDAVEAVRKMKQSCLLELLPIPK